MLNGMGLPERMAWLFAELPGTMSGASTSRIRAQTGGPGGLGRANGRSIRRKHDGAALVTSPFARVEGPNLTLRLIDPADADYVHALRTDPVYNRHLSKVRGTALDQRRWIEDYKAREAALRELYYVIERKDGVRCGLVRLYDIEDGSYTWGSWILDHNKPPKAALESAVLSFGVGFDRLGCCAAHLDVRIGNDKALAFYQRLKMTELRRDGSDVYFLYPRSQFEADRAGYLAILEKGCA